ncbi:MAG: DUF2723 domain-containing protein [Ardenticatenaceae bacterium]|nr:DUF2723 domain-containing protein [Ardenticatenaceae bacterium]
MQTWFRQHRKMLYSLGTAVFAFIFYWATLAPDLTWQANSGDGGELITAAVTLGIPHPPGYPTYVLLGKLASFLPFEPVAYRFHLFSALCVAIAAGLVTATAQKLMAASGTQNSQFLTVIPGLLFAFSPLVWSQAIVAEVYSLNLLVVAAFLWAIVGKRPSHVTGFFLGLSVTTHLTSLFLLPLALANSPLKTWRQLFIGALVGASPYLLLPFLARLGSPVLWGDLTTLSGWWWLVSGQIYQANQFALPPNNFWPRLASWAGAFSQQLAMLGWPLLFLAGWRVVGGRFFSAKLWGGLVGTAVFYLIYAFFYNTQDAIVLTLPAWLILSLCLIPALNLVGKWGVILPGLALLLNLTSQNGANIHNIRQQAAQIFASAPADAVLITSGDPDIFTLWYFHYVEGQRPDIILVDDKLLAFDWYRHHLRQQHSSLRGLEEDDLAQFTAANQPQRAICQTHFSSQSDGKATIDCLQDSNE